MKRFLLVVIACMLLLSMAGAVSAEAYGTTFYGTNFEESYSEHLYNNAFYVRYTIGNFLTNVTGSTSVSVSNDAYGEAFVQITGLNGQVDYSRGYTVSNNWISSGLAGVADTDYAKQMLHTGERTISGYTDTWTVYYK